MTPDLDAPALPVQATRSFATALIGFLGSTVATTAFLFLINQF